MYSVHLVECLRVVGLLLVFCYVEPVPTTDDIDTLVVVNVLFRHGQRTPEAVYPNDKYQEGTWPQGFGHLTQKGKQEARELGSFLRAKYDGFLKDNYMPNQIFIQTSYTYRTFASANWTLSGLYPTEVDQPWNSTINRLQPVDDLLNPIAYKCNYYDKLLADFLKSQEVLSYYEENKEFLKYLFDKTGYNDTQDNNICGYNCYDIHDAITIEMAFNLTQPAWVTEDVLVRTGEISIHEFVFRNENTDMVRLKGGPILQTMIANMDKQITSNEQTIFYMYSGHDTTIIPVAIALGIFNGVQPPLASCLGVELWRDQTNEYYVKIWYRNDSTVEPYVMSLPGCDDRCPFEDFKRLTKDVLPGDIKQACVLVSNVLKKGYLLFLMVGIIFIMVYIMVYVRMKMKRHTGTYEAMRPVDKSDTQTPTNNIPLIQRDNAK